METTNRLARELAYNAWANREALRSLLAAQAAPPRAAEVMTHIAGGAWRWLRRRGHRAPELPVWPVLPLGESDVQLRALSRAWKDFLAGASEDSLGREVAYTNTKGERWANAVADVLTHVILRSSYH